MASDLVNDTGKKQLSVKNQEPTHLGGASYEDLGGTGIDSKPNSVKIDSAKGVGTDTSIKGAGSNREGSHLPDASGVEDKLDLAFGEDDEKVDDLDKELDDLDNLHEVEIEIGKKDDDGDDDKKDKDDDKKEKVDEEAEGGDTDSGKLSFNDVQEDDDDKDKDGDDDNPFAKKELKEDGFPFGKKKDDGDDDKSDDDKDKDDDDKKTKVVVKEDEDKDEDKREKDEKDAEKVEETFRVVIDTPASNLFESAGLAPKTQKKVAAIFEQAIRSNTKQIAEQLHKHYGKKYRRQLAERNSVFEKQIDSYLGFVVEEWLRSNKVAVRTSLRAQMAEEFLNGLHQLFTESYIDVPASKVDVVKQLARKVDSLTEQINTLTADRIKLRRLAEAANKARIVSQYSQGMSANEVAKLSKLAEDVKYETAKDFREKLSMLKESYFGSTKVEDGKLKRLPAEQLTEEKKQETKPVTDPGNIGDVVADAISRAAASKW